MIDVARQKAGPLLSRRVFLRTEAGEPKLPFDEAAFDLVVSNLGLHESAQPHLLLRELARVAKPGAQIITHCRCANVCRILFAARNRAARTRAGTAAAVFPPAKLARCRRGGAGPKPQVWPKSALISPFSLLFAGAVDLYYAPLIEFGPLLSRKSLFDRDPAGMQAVFVSLRDRLNSSVPSTKRRRWVCVRRCASHLH